MTALDIATDVTRRARSASTLRLRRLSDVRTWARSCQQVSTDRLLAALPDDLSATSDVAAALGRVRDDIGREHERHVSGLRHEQQRLDTAMADLELEQGASPPGRWSNL